jgi:hypothetical protein
MYVCGFTKALLYQQNTCPPLLHLCSSAVCLCLFLVAILSMVQQTFACYSVLEILCSVLLMLCDSKYSSDVRFVCVCVCAIECIAHVIE